MRSAQDRPSPLDHRRPLGHPVLSLAAVAMRGTAGNEPEKSGLLAFRAHARTTCLCRMNCERVPRPCPPFS